MEREYQVIRNGLTGIHIRENFGYSQCLDAHPDFNIIKELVFNGHYHGSVVYVIRKFIDTSICERLVEAFDQEIAEAGGNREFDGYVLTSQLGSTQFSRNGLEYMEEILRVGKSTLHLMGELSEDTVEAMFLTRFLEEGFLEAKVHYGPARYKNAWAQFATFSRWLDNGAMALMPHEDYAQLHYAKEDGFEISVAQTVTSFNVCLEGGLEGGELVVWNFKPDDECREKLGVCRTGYPYPLEGLQGIEHLTLRLNQGDLYFINACHLHGVQTVSRGQRLTAGRFIGKLSDRKVVFWT